MTIDLNIFDEDAINEAIMSVQIYRDSIDQKASKLVGEVSERVEEYAAYELSKHVWSGDTLASLKRRYKVGAMTARVIVGGAAVWLEFGTGVVANDCVKGEYMHPKAVELGMFGIGEYGHGRGSDPNGWDWYDDSGQFWHTYGIPATRFMYHSAWNARADLPGLARRIFKT